MSMIESHSLSEHLFGEAVKAAKSGEYRKALHYIEQVLIMNPRHAKAGQEKEAYLHHMHGA
jgi:hypothetical protein